MILTKKQNKCVIVGSRVDSSGCYVIIEFEINDTKIVLASLYAPNHNDPHFFTQLFADVMDFENPTMIVVGDFNLVMDVEIDHSTDSKFNPKNFYHKLCNIIEEHNLIDYWCILNPTQCVYSWYKRNPKYAGSRVDFVLVDPSITSSTQYIEYKSGYKTDHLLII